MERRINFLKENQICSSKSFQFTAPALHHENNWLQPSEEGTWTLLQRDPDPRHPTGDTRGRGRAAPSHLRATDTAMQARRNSPSPFRAAGLWPWLVPPASSPTHPDGRRRRSRDGVQPPIVCLLSSAPADVIRANGPKRGLEMQAIRLEAIRLNYY